MIHLFLTIVSGAFALLSICGAIYWAMRGDYETAAMVFIFAGACSGFFSAEVQS